MPRWYRDPVHGRYFPRRFVSSQRYPRRVSSFGVQAWTPSAGKWFPFLKHTHVHACVCLIASCTGRKEVDYRPVPSTNQRRPRSDSELHRDSSLAKIPQLLRHLRMAALVDRWPSCRVFTWTDALPWSWRLSLNVISPGLSTIRFGANDFRYTKSYANNLTFATVKVKIHPLRYLFISTVISIAPIGVYGPLRPSSHSVCLLSALFSGCRSQLPSTSPKSVAVCLNDGFQGSLCDARGRFRLALELRRTCPTIRFPGSFLRKGSAIPWADGGLGRSGIHKFSGFNCLRALGDHSVAH